MKKLINAILLIHFIIAFSSCSSGDREIDKVIAANEKPVLAIVLCDVSTSITLLDSNDLRNFQKIIMSRMAKTCKDLLRHYPAESKISYFLISSSAVPYPFLSYEPEVAYQTNFREIVDSLDKLDLQLDHIIDSASRQPETFSCILTSIESAYKTFASSNQNHPGRYRNELIILSDMIEECPNSPIGRIMMHRDKTKPFLYPEQAVKLDSLSTRNIDFDNASVEIKVCLNTNNLPNRNIDPITLTNLETAWKKIFASYGYKKVLDKNFVLLQPNMEFDILKDYK